MKQQAFIILQVEEIGPYEWIIAGRLMADISVGDILECEHSDAVDADHQFTVTHMMAYNHSFTTINRGMTALVTVQGRQGTCLSEWAFLVFSGDSRGLGHA